MKLIFWIIAIELGLVAWWDLKHKKISNWWLPLNLFLALIFHFAFPEFYPWSWMTLVFPVGCLIIGFVFFIMNIMGAGDSKYLASLFLLMPADQHMLYLEKLALSTIAVGSILIAFTLSRHFNTLKAYFLNRHWSGIKEIIRSHFSYAPVMLLAWILLGARL